MKTNLKLYREAAGMTQHDLADHSGVSIHAVRQLETSRNCNPTADTMRRLAYTLDIELLDIFPIGD